MWNPARTSSPEGWLKYPGTGLSLESAVLNMLE